MQHKPLTSFYYRRRGGGGIPSETLKANFLVYISASATNETEGVCQKIPFYDLRSVHNTTKRKQPSSRQQKRTHNAIKTADQD